MFSQRQSRDTPTRNGMIAFHFNAPFSLTIQQPRGQCDGRRRECLRDRAALLGGLGQCSKLLLVDARNARIELEGDRLDRESVAVLHEIHGRGDVKLRGDMASLPEYGRQRHREASRMSRTEQLLRVRPCLAVLALEARLVRIGLLVKDAALSRECPASSKNVSLPDSRASSNHGALLPECL